MAGYVVLAMLGEAIAGIDRLTVWYPPVGLAMAAAALLGWRVYPALALGEIIVGATLFGVAGDLGWLIVPNGLAYAAVLTAGGHAMTRLGGTSSEVSWRRPLAIVAVGAVGTPLAAAVVGVGFQAVAGVVSLADVPGAVGVWALGDAVGAASIGITVVTIAVRHRRGGRWWALPDMSTATSIALLLSPAVLVTLFARAFEGVVPFIVVALVPYVVLCVIGGVPAAGLAAPFTSVAVTIAAVDAFAGDLIRLVDVQVLLLLVMTLGLFAGMVVEERRELHLRLAERERHLRRAEVQARAGSFQWDIPAATVWFSDGLLRLLGRDTQPAGATDWVQHVHASERELLRSLLRRVVEDGTGFETTCRIVTDGGDEVVARIVLTSRHFDGRVVEAVGTVTDVTTEFLARQRLAEALDRQREAAEAHRRAADESTRAAALFDRAERIREALLIAVSHEIRTPLTVILGLVETMQRPGATERLPLSSMLQRLDRNTRRLDRVLTDLLDVERISRGVIEPRPTEVDVAPLIDTVIERVGIDRSLVDVRIARDAAVARLDAGITERILEHLLLNAKKHAPDVPVEVHATITDGRFELRVEDHGPGLPVGDVDELLRAFRSAAHDRSNPGTGVGLYLVDQFTSLHGGSVRLDARKGGGTTVTVVLPEDGSTVIELPAG